MCWSQSACPSLALSFALMALVKPDTSYIVLMLWAIVRGASVSGWCCRRSAWARCGASTSR
jgi:hypothetical protein